MTTFTPYVKYMNYRKLKDKFCTMLRVHLGYPRRAWAATGIVVCLFVCLFVTGESAHLGAMALRLQHG